MEVGVMPKEQITSTVTWRGIRPEGAGQCRCLYDDESCDCDEVCSTSTYPTLTVRWNGNHGRVTAVPPMAVEDIPACNVQLTLTEYEEIPWPEYKARLREAGEDRLVSREIAGESFTKVLTRSEINNLIRVLKRARDAAYGRDE